MQLPSVVLPLAVFERHLQRTFDLHRAKADGAASWDVYLSQFWKVAPRQASVAAEARASVPEVVEATTSERVTAHTR